MTACAQDQAQSAAEMTPPGGLQARAKQILLRGVLDRVRPLAYRRAPDALRCLTFHYQFAHERPHAERLFAALKREGDFVRTDELVALLEGDARPRGRLFHLSVDDGFENIATEAHPVLKGLGIPYALMVCPDYIGADPDGLAAFARNARYAKPLALASWETLERLADDGVEIGAHTMGHRHVASLEDMEIAREVAGPRKAIEARLGRPCRSFAWPFGKVSAMSQRALATAREAGYTTVFSSVRGTLAPGRGIPAYLPRHHFEPGWPIDAVVYYATRAEPAFVPPLLPR